MRILPRCQILLLALLFFPIGHAAAQGTREDYQRAEQFLPGNLRHRIYVADVAPHWIAKKNRFWYRKAGTKGAEFLLVDAEQSTTGPAFDHVRLAGSLSKALKREVQPMELPFDSIEFSEDGKSISFQVDGAPWSCTLEKYDCKRGPEPVAGQYEEASPNKEWVAYVKDHDLYVRYVETGEIIRLTRDGEASYDYATEIAGLRPFVAQGTQEIRQRPAVSWSPDSSKLVTYRMDTRNAGRFSYLQFVPPNQLRPKEYTVVYPLPGEVLPKAEPIIFEVQSGKRIEVKTAPLEIQFQGGPGFDWYENGRAFSYDAWERGEKSIELREVDAARVSKKLCFAKKARSMWTPERRISAFCTKRATFYGPPSATAGTIPIFRI
ncbi:MAG TPA: DPP IV N-terminal domain-containing protein [Candidatus Acidoferrum sp.]